MSKLNGSKFMARRFKKFSRSPKRRNNELTCSTKFQDNRQDDSEDNQIEDNDNLERDSIQEQNDEDEKVDFEPESSEGESPLNFESEDVKEQIKEDKKIKKNKNKSIIKNNNQEEDKEEEESDSKSPKSINNNKKYILFVGNLPFGITDKEIKKFFGAIEPHVVDVRQLTCATTGKPKGCAFVEFDSGDAVRKALKYSGFQLGERKIRIEITAQGKGKSAKRVDKIKKRNQDLHKLRKKHFRQVQKLKQTKSSTSSPENSKTKK